MSVPDQAALRARSLHHFLRRKQRPIAIVLAASTVIVLTRGPETAVFIYIGAMFVLSVVALVFSKDSFVKNLAVFVCLLVIARFILI